MRFYLIDEPGNDEQAEWAGTQEEARAVIRAIQPPFRAAMRVSLVEVEANRANLLALLKGEIPEVSAPLRSWRGTARGGLRPTPRD